jgi:hypothetical protein
MTDAERIRDYCIKNFILPGRKIHAKIIEIHAKEVHDGLSLTNSFPNVCQALQSKKFEELANCKLIKTTEPNPSSTCIMTFEII